MIDIGTRVRIIAEADPFTDWTGTVDRTYDSDPRGTVYLVQFGDGNCAYYYANELACGRDPRRATCG